MHFHISELEHVFTIESLYVAYTSQLDLQLYQHSS